MTQRLAYTDMHLAQFWPDHLDIDGPSVMVRVADVQRSREPEERTAGRTDRGERCGFTIPPPSPGPSPGHEPAFSYAMLNFAV